MRARRVGRVLASVVTVGALAATYTSCSEDEPAGSAVAVEETSEAAVVTEVVVEGEPEPVVETTKVERREPIAFGSQTRRTSELKKGVTRVAQRGSTGVRLKVWRVTTTDGEETGRKLLRSVVVRKPVPRITLVGTYVAPPPPAPT